MALLFGATASDRVEVADSASLRNLTSATYLCWTYVTATTSSRFAQKGVGASANARQFGITTGTLTIQVSRATTATNATATLTNFPAWATNKWVFAAGVHDTGGIDGGQKLYIGDLNALAAEPSAYSTQVVGSGALGDNTANIQMLGVNGAGTANSLPGRMAVLQIFNRVLTLAEIHSLQFRPRAIDGCVGYWIFGGTTGTQADYSGNANAGTVTGATVADHVPLPPAFGYDLWVEIARAASPASVVGSAGARAVCVGAKNITAPMQARAGARGLDVGTTARSATSVGRAGACGLVAGSPSATAQAMGKAGARGQDAAVTTRGSALASKAGARGLCAGTKTITATVQSRAGARSLDVGVSVRSAAVVGRTGARSQCVGGTSSSVTGQVVGRSGARAQDVGVAARSAASVGRAGARAQCAGAKTVTVAVQARTGARGLAAGTASGSATGSAVGRAGARAACAGVASRTATITGRAGGRVLVAGSTQRTASIVSRAGARGQCAVTSARTSGLIGRVGSAGQVVGAVAHVQTVIGTVGGYGLSVRQTIALRQVEWAIRLERSRWLLGPPVQ